MPPTPVPDLDLRVVRYFVTLAEHRTFADAAAVLGITQPALSRQMRRFEQELGVELLARTPHGTSLTPAGESFLPEARTLLAAARRAGASLGALLRPDRITIGWTTTVIVTPAVRELRLRRPSAQVETVHLPWNAARTAVLERDVDAVVTRLPLADADLHLTPLYEELRVLLVGEDHRLAGRPSVSVLELAADPMPRVEDEAWNAFWRIDPRPDGSPAPDGPPVRTLEDKLELVASGAAVAVIAATEYDNTVRPDVVAVPLTDAEPSQVVLATRAGETSPLVVAFRAVARAVLTGPVPPPPDRPEAPGPVRS